MTAIYFRQMTGLNAVKSLGNGLNHITQVTLTNRGVGYVKGEILSIEDSGLTAIVEAQVKVLEVGKQGEILAYTLEHGGLFSDAVINTVQTDGVSAADGEAAKFTVEMAENAVPWGTRSVRLVPEAQNVRMRDDNVDPSATVGHLLIANSTYDLSNEDVNLNHVKFIEATATAKLNVTYYD